jgi:hypothetical protein
MGERLNKSLVYLGVFGLFLFIAGRFVNIYGPVLAIWELNENLGVGVSTVGIGVLMITAIFLFYFKSRDQG